MNRPAATASSETRIRGVLGRLEAVLDQENAGIGRDKDFDLAQSNALKSRCLYEMTLLLRDAGPRGLDPAHANQLSAVREKLQLNASRIRAHMEAVREVTDMIKDVVTAAEDDGTYSADQFRGYEF